MILHKLYLPSRDTNLFSVIPSENVRLSTAIVGVFFIHALDKMYGKNVAYTYFRPRNVYACITRRIPSS